MRAATVVMNRHSDVMKHSEPDNEERNPPPRHRVTEKELDLSQCLCASLVNGLCGEIGLMIIGVISDTHGKLRSEAIEALKGVDRILHAGDVGDPHVLDALAQIAPVTAIRGNVDSEPWAKSLPETEVVEVDGVSIYMLHDLAKLDLKPKAAGIAAVIYGHSHQPKIEEKN